MNPSLACARAFQRRGIVNCLRAHREPLRSISVINWESTTGVRQRVDTTSQAVDDDGSRRTEWCSFATSSCSR